jgi:hypothetical protein
MKDTALRNRFDSQERRNLGVFLRHSFARSAVLQRRVRIYPGAYNSSLRLPVHGTPTALAIWSSAMASTNQPKSVTLPDILTDAQIAHEVKS